MATDPDDRQWTVVQYEAQMLFAACQLLAPEPNPSRLQKLLIVRGDHAQVPDSTADLPFFFRNGVTELAVLHCRILIDILISRSSKEDDITLGELLPGCVIDGVDALRDAYGDGKDGSEDKPCWQFNKLLAHATKKRGSEHDYASALRKVLPSVVRVLASIQVQRPTFDLNVPDN